SGNFALRNLSIFNSKYRYSGLAIQNENESEFSRLHQRGNLFSFDRDIEQDRRGGQVHIPEVVMHGLEIPFELAGRCIECNDGIAEEIISFAVETVVVARRTA